MCVCVCVCRFDKSGVQIVSSKAKIHYLYHSSLLSLIFCLLHEFIHSFILPFNSPPPCALHQGKLLYCRPPPGYNEAEIAATEQLLVALANEKVKSMDSAVITGPKVCVVLCCGVVVCGVWCGVVWWGRTQRVHVSSRMYDFGHLISYRFLFLNSTIRDMRMKWMMRSSRSLRCRR